MINYVLGEAKNKINITDEELLEYFNKNKDSFFEPEKIHALHILVETEEEANNILNKLKEGIIDFAELAKQKSIDASAQNGGDLGFFTRGQMVKEFEDAAFSLKPGEISNVVKTEFGYHIIKLVEKKEAYNPTFEEAKENINNILKNQKEIEATQNLISNLTANANIIINYDFESENQSSSSSPKETQTSNSTSIEEISPEETTNNNQVKDTAEIK
jgi:parvulin-like peptidyl-prolyl isomerase